MHLKKTRIQVALGLHVIKAANIITLSYLVVTSNTTNERGSEGEYINTGQVKSGQCVVDESCFTSTAFQLFVAILAQSSYFYSLRMSGGCMDTRSNVKW